MRWKLCKRHLRFMIRNAIVDAKKNREICGLLVYNGFFVELIKLKNISKKCGSFLFDSKEIEYFKKIASDMQHEIIGTFHSHLSSEATPGISDVRYAWDDTLMLIISARDRSVNLWKIKNRRKYRLSYKII